MALPETISARVWKLGDDVNTDILHPPTFFSLNEVRMKEGIADGMERLSAGLKDHSVKEGWVIVAGVNFGCGSSRETSVRGLRAFGVKGVVATSFARIFQRSLVNLGIPVFVCREIQQWANDGDLIRISLSEGTIRLKDSRTFPFLPMDDHHKKILEAGGLIPYLRREIDEI